MYDLVIDNVRLVMPDGIRPGSIGIRNGKIAAVAGPASLSGERTEDGEDLFLSPGFIDIHVHGGGGHDFMDGTVEAVRGALKAHMEHGTTSIFPTSLTSEDEELEAMFDAVIKVRDSRDPFLPCIPGVHLEGPYVAASMAGAQDPKYIKDPSPDDWRKIVRMGRGTIRIWTVAPEKPGALDMARELAGDGIVFSAGHSEAEYSDAVEALRAGYTMATHLYSSMSTIKRVNGSRVPGLLEAAMLHDGYCAEVIADGMHLPAPLLRLTVKTKGVRRIVLVTDAMRGAGMPEGESILGSLSKGQKVMVSGGIARMPDGISFAGSVATADRLVRVMAGEAGVPLCDAVRMMTENPARETGLGASKGSLAAGYDADLVLFDEGINVKKVFVGGVRTV